MSKSLSSLAIVLALAAGTAEAAPKRPFIVEPAKETNVVVDRYQVRSAVERARTPGKERAVFTVDPAEVSEGAQYVFTAFSIGPEGRTKRWQCSARKNVSECFPGKLAVPYLEDDQKIVLEVVAEREASQSFLHAERR